MELTQKTFSCSKSTIETIQKDLRRVQSCQYRHQNDATVAFIVNLKHILYLLLVFLLLLWTSKCLLSIITKPSSKLTLKDIRTTLNRSSHLQVFWSILKYFANFTWEHLRWGVIIKTCWSTACNFTKNALLHKRFPMKLMKFFSSAFFIKNAF